MKPTLFIGSSSEKLQYAYSLQTLLESKAEVTVWNQGVFKLNRSYLDSLVDALDTSDFGVFVLAPDDSIEIRDKKLSAVRDNVLFELGLFMGKLGPERAFFLVPKEQENLQLPSDLHGLATVNFDAGRTPIDAALGPASYKIAEAIEAAGIRQGRLAQPTIEIIKAPKVLCVCSKQYLQLSFEKDVELIRRETRRISAEISELHETNSERLTDTLMEGKFDIVHLCAFVDPKTGDILFSDVDKYGIPLKGVTIDSMAAVSFSRLIELAGTKLVVLATCDSLMLAAKLARACNMIAATDWVSVEEILKWELGLYKCLAKGASLSNAYETASSLSKAPMLLFLKKDLAFQ